MFQHNDRAALLNKRMSQIQSHWKICNLLHLVTELLVASNSQGEDGAGAGCMTNGFIPVFYRPEPQYSR